MYSLGKYIIFVKEVLTNNDSIKKCFKRTMNECVLIGLNSVFIIFFISIILGIVISLQTIATLRKSIIFQHYMLGFGIRDISIAELAPMVTVLIFTGRIGSSIAGEIGSMKITEQIDALEVMGINSKSYLVLPKILGCLLMYPLLVFMSVMVLIFTSFIYSTKVDTIVAAGFIEGLRLQFTFKPIYEAVIKIFVFSFLISSISSYVGYSTRGGALELGKMTTKAVTFSMVSCLIVNYLIVQAFA